MHTERVIPIRSLLALLALVLVGVGIFSLLERLEREARQNRLVQLPPIDYTFTRVDYSALDDSGNLRVLVSAKTMVHDRLQKSLQLTLPRVRRLSEVDAGVQILDAQSAVILEQGKRLQLDGGVTLRSTKPDGTTAQMKVNDLTLITEAKTAFTESPVEIQQGSTKVFGRGLRADFNTQELEILHDFHSIIVPRSR